ncbi:MAG: PVC-type heme-binding CxxCH protein [Planctomycetaceae bacterium]
MKSMVLGGLLLSLAGHAVGETKPLFDSKLVCVKKKGHAVDIDVDLQGSRKLFLVVNDGDNGFSCDWADWAEPRLLGPKGELKLTDLKWASASAGWGQVRKNQNVGGGPLRINGQPVEFGIGTHANSMIEFDVPAGYTRFQARGGLDNGGTDQGDGSATTVRFCVFNKKPPRRFTTASKTQDNGNRDAESAVAGLDVPDDLEVSLFASEPLMFSPSNMDIDHLGRVWICEVVNYRHFRNKANPPREAGDRILVLEDTDGDGKADKTTTFYQGRDIDSAHGVCVLGNKVIVSAGDSVFVLTDDGGDLKSDRKEVLFTGIAGTQHDHGIHAFVFGPDGKLYFNFGNAGKQIKDRNGKPIIDKAGNEVNDSRKPYQEGMVFRCNLDGSEFETLGWNFRNNWEVCVDSFGTLWQSDNDDDGNRGVRINFVMEYGNYGYKDELTGAGWRSPRTGWEDEIPQRHWHLNDPGVMPNLLQTGAGSPTGICVYEGTLLPERFQNQIIHCDAGPNIVRAYPAKKDGAGYTATIENILEGTRDKWFRPSDVCVAPDGSLLIADWYDPGVGGHAMGDIERGRIFRVAPPKTPYSVPKVDLSNPAGAIQALQSPNHATRYMAWMALKEMGPAAKMELTKLWRSDNPRMRARALWLLGELESETMSYVTDAITDGDPDIRIVGLRLARRKGLDLQPILRRLFNDLAPEVRRECLVALAEQKTSPELLRRWADLAQLYEEGDRWYLEALGSAARGRWDQCLSRWFRSAGHPQNLIQSQAARDIVWRSRGSETPKYLAMILNQQTDSAARYFRAFDFLDKEVAAPQLIQLAFADHKGDADRKTFIMSEAISRVDSSKLNGNPKYAEAIESLLKDVAGTPQFTKLVERFGMAAKYPDVLKLAQENAASEIGIDAIRMLLRKKQWDIVTSGLTNESEDVAVATADVLGNSADGNAAGPLLFMVKNANAPLAVRRACARNAGKLNNGAMQMAKLVEQKKLDPTLTEAVAAALHSSSSRNVKEKANALFPPPPSKDNKPLPTLAQLVPMKGDVSRGKLVFHNSGTCFKCHQVNGLGREVGPDLSEIGKKLSRRAMFESILYPSAGISHNYETYVVLLDSGTSVTGLKMSETEESITLKDVDAISRTFQKDEVDEMVKQSVSLMPADLQKLMTAQELVDVIEYMQTLKKKK